MELKFSCALKLRCSSGIFGLSSPRREDHSSKTAESEDRSFQDAFFLGRDHLLRNTIPTSETMCVHIDTGVCNMYRLRIYTFLHNFCRQEYLVQRDVFFSETSHPVTPRNRGLLGAWSEALQWMLLSMTLSIFNKWTLGSAQCWWKLQSEA